MRTLTASFLDGHNYTFNEKTGLLRFEGTSYADLTSPAQFMSILNGFTRMTTMQNGLGNDLPLYQQVSAIFRAKQNLRAAMSNLEGIRSNLHDGLSTRNTIYDNSILKPTKNGAVIGNVYVRSDFDHNGTNKSSAQMNFSELMDLSILKSYYFNLFRNKGKILLQSTCLSDKHTHFMIEYLTKDIKLYDGTLLFERLKDASNLNRNIRDNASNAILSEIKERRSRKVKVQVSNFINRYNAIFGLSPDADKNESFKSLLEKLNTLHELFNSSNYSKQGLYDLSKNALNGVGVDVYNESDLIEVGGKIYMNETLYHNFLIYASDDDSKFIERIERQMLKHAELMFKNHFVLDGELDPDVQRLINSFTKQNSGEAIL